MDFKVFVVLTTLLVLTAAAEIADNDKNITEASLQPKIQHKRHQRFRMKDILLFLTPSQINAYNSGRGLPQHAVKQIKDVQKQEVEKVQKEESRKKQSYEQEKQQLAEANRKSRLQLEEAESRLQLQDFIKHQLKEINEQELKIEQQRKIDQQQRAEHQQKIEQQLKELAEQQKRLEQQQRNAEQQKIEQQLKELADQQQKLEQQQRLAQHQKFEQKQKKEIKKEENKKEEQSQPQENDQKHQKSEKSLQYLPDPQKLHENIHFKPDHLPENFAYMYLFPEQAHQLQALSQEPYLHHPEPVRNVQILDQPQLQLFPHEFQLVPYEYAHQQHATVQVEQHVPTPHVVADHHITEAVPIQPVHQAVPLVVHEQPAVVHEVPQAPAVVAEPVQIHHHHHHHDYAHQISEVLPEAMPLLGHHLNSGKLQELEFHKLQPHQLEFQNLGAHLHPEYIAHNAHLEGQSLAAHLETKHLSEHAAAKNLAAHIRAKDIAAHLKAKELAHIEAHKHAAHDAKHIEAHDDYDHHIHSHIHDHDLGHIHSHSHIHEHGHNNDHEHVHDYVPEHVHEHEVHHPKHDDFKTEKLKAYIKAQESEKKFEIEKQKSEQLKNKILAQSNSQKQKIEAMRLDAHHQLEELEADVEKVKASLESIKVPEVPELPKHTKLFEPHNEELHQQVLELLKQREKFEKNPPPFQSGFTPLKHKPIGADNDKLIKEVEKILIKAHLEKQAALAKAAKENSETFKFEEHKKLPTKQIDVPFPFIVPVPKPYPVPLNINNYVPVPVVKTEKVEVLKPVPYEVEKHVPYEVTKNVYVPIDKPYLVEKKVPVEITKKVPVKIPVHKKQKITVIRHVWDQD